MKTIGLIGGMSWESTSEYYRIINEEIKERLGGLHSAKCLINSVDFEEIERCQSSGDWDGAGEILGNAAYSLQKGGADFIIICTNTMHKVVGKIKAKIDIPVLHIADATAKEIKRKDIQKVGLLGTKYTMEQDFYKSRIEEHDIKVIVPSGTNREKVNEVIYTELCLGKIVVQSREYYKRVIEELVQEGAQGIILGCTEIGLLIKQENVSVPIFDTTHIHAIEAVKVALYK
ncbi:aspartate/glutamate racemase family protein [Paenibacillus jamilae]|uniref:Aspartate racemase n=1 Tax=Bacillus thuringiensis serovar subtoxicus TaxID=475791 RepID=A0A9X6IL04_BACTU|nr:aspartate/glutamate racemase family protein [Bacillus thuringiensis]MEB4843325.1 aspartate/glutamate racemase family protein [Paenibacillus jamilae]MEB8582855.1 aspartate/glutamate racemase family protein [Bacillus cereus]MCR6851760.1 aspartate/glutamate racemase family protein [Bacillus thuringiensis]MDR4283396.1 aspartate/glutamate racemase family protein [Bacillus thuringiensis]MEB8597494.1 aspartate/glutamate racemase family protein [Bacillus cereus]